MGTQADPLLLSELDVEEQLFHALFLGGPGECQGLLERVEDIDVKNASGRTLLHVAVKLGKIEWVEALLAMGSDPDVSDRNGLSVSQVAEDMKRKFPEDRDRGDIAKLVCILSKWKSAVKTARIATDRASCDETSGTRVEGALGETVPIVRGPSMEIEYLQGTIDDLKSEATSLRDSLLEQVASLSDAIEDMKHTLISRDVLLERLEVSVTSLVEGWCPMRESPSDACAKVEDVGKDVEELNQAPHPRNLSMTSVGVTEETKVRFACVESFMKKTRILNEHSWKISKVKRLYDKLYSTSCITSSLMKFLQFRSKLRVVIDCDSFGVQNMVQSFQDVDGQECKGKDSRTFTDVDNQTIHLAGKVGWFEMPNYLNHFLAFSLARIAMHLLFQNDGKPYAIGDWELGNEYMKILDEAEGKKNLGVALDRNIDAALGRMTRRGREIGLILVVPTMLALYGSTVGALRLHQQLPRLIKYYEDHVMVTVRQAMVLTARD